MDESVQTRIAGEQGIAMLTVILIMLIMTTLGLTAIAVTALETRMAGNVLGQETAIAAAESCVGTAVNIIQQTIAVSGDDTALASYYGTGGPIPSSSAWTTLKREIMGFPDSSNNPTENSPDVALTSTGAVSAPNTQVTVGPYTVYGDIDRLYVRAKAGSGIQSHAGNEGIGGGTTGGGADVYYRVDCTAQNVAVGNANRIVAVFACNLTGDACQKKL